MSVFDGVIEFPSLYSVDYVKKIQAKDPRKHVTDDGCIIVGASRDSLKVSKEKKYYPDVLCPVHDEYYKDAVDRYSKKYPSLKKLFPTEIDPTPILHKIQDSKRTMYLCDYCSRELPFMSVNLARRAKALQTLRLDDDVYIPSTSTGNAHRAPGKEKYAETPKSQSLGPKFDNSLSEQLRKILRVKTGESSYMVSHGLLAQVILDEKPYGPPRKEPKFGKWKTPHWYTYRLA